MSLSKTHLSLLSTGLTLEDLQSLKLLRPMVKEKHLQENTLFDL